MRLQPHDPGSTHDGNQPLVNLQRLDLKFSRCTVDPAELKIWALQSSVFPSSVKFLTVENIPPIFAEGLFEQLATNRRFLPLLEALPRLRRFRYKTDLFLDKIGRDGIASRDKALRALRARGIRPTARELDMTVWGLQ